MIFRMSYVYDVKIKMLPEQWLQQEMKFLVGYNIRTSI